MDTRVELKAPVRLNDFVRSNKLELSLKSYLELVMSNNTDIQIQMLSLETPKNAIMRALATWDPTATASFSSTRSKSPAVTALDGANTSESLSQPANFSVTQVLPTGGQYSVGFAAAKSSTNSSYALLNPNLNAGLTLNFSQPLLRNRGYYVNHLNLMVARSRYRQADYNLRSTLLQLVEQAESAYWDVIQARENLHVAESAQALADATLKLSQRELELGALSPLDIFNPEQQLATATLGVSQARFSLAQTENALRKQIGADLDPAIRELPIVLTETVDLPVGVEVNTEKEVEVALQSRPDLKAAIQSLDLDDLGLRSAQNEALPNLSFNASYQTRGIGGIVNPYTDPIPGGLGDALSQMFGFGYPSYTVGVNLQFPIRSHAVAADMADARSQKKRDALTVRNTQQQVRLSILNAVNNLESSKKSLELAKAASDFAAKYLDAENQKYTLGIDQMQFVLQAQNTLTQAQSSVVQAQVGLRRNLLNLYTQTGELLDQRGIVVQ
ncbi:MAG TPA: TolC family protein [Candidatus Sulfopaludibacter sp.]|nr:TolC family protein [Candidatus Sulfopaludibacter sp.]